MDAYEKYHNGVSVEDIAKLYNVSEDFVREAIETQTEADDYLAK
jgi:uncharacterized protein (DUF433 family)